MIRLAVSAMLPLQLGVRQQVERDAEDKKMADDFV